MKPSPFTSPYESKAGDGVCDKSFCHDWGRDARLVACCFIKMLGSGKCSAEAEYFCHHWTYYGTWKLQGICISKWLQMHTLGPLNPSMLFRTEPLSNWGYTLHCCTADTLKYTIELYFEIKWHFIIQSSSYGRLWLKWPSTKTRSITGPETLCEGSWIISRTPRTTWSTSRYKNTKQEESEQDFKTETEPSEENLQISWNKLLKGVKNA